MKNILIFFAIIFFSCGEDEVALTLEQQMPEKLVVGVWLSSSSTDVSVYYASWQERISFDLRIATDVCAPFSSGYPCANVTERKVQLDNQLASFVLTDGILQPGAAFLSAGISNGAGSTASVTVDLGNGDIVPKSPPIFSKALSYHKVVQFTDSNNKTRLWMIGGRQYQWDMLSKESSVFSSSDAVEWTPANSLISFVNLMGHNVLVMPDPANGKNAMWVIGGHDGYSYTNYVHKSYDGISWELVLPEVSVFSPRAGQSATVFPDPANNNKPTIWIIGGRNDLQNFNDVWKSTNGKDWTRVSANAPFNPRAFAELVVKHDNGKKALWLFGGGDNQTWKSSDGVDWTLIVPMGKNFPPVSGHSVVVVKDRSEQESFFLMGGYSNGVTQSNVWSSRDGANWTMASELSQWKFPSRAYHNAVVMNDLFNTNEQSILITGGMHSSKYYLSDSWKTKDGAAFHQAIKCEFQF